MNSRTLPIDLTLPREKVTTVVSQSSSAFPRSVTHYIYDCKERDLIREGEIAVRKANKRVVSLRV